MKLMMKFGDHAHLVEVYPALPQSSVALLVVVEHLEHYEYVIIVVLDLRALV
ncbi:MAG: hypothetical protein QUS08_09290 [Methanothrix sp.]|nr:hypothetical protein [Methanothrix sp.]